VPVVFVLIQIIVHDTYDSLYQYFPKDVLPDEYGGTAGSIEKIEGNVCDGTADTRNVFYNLSSDFTLDFISLSAFTGRQHLMERRSRALVFFFEDKIRAQYPVRRTQLIGTLYLERTSRISNVSVLSLRHSN